MTLSKIRVKKQQLILRRLVWHWRDVVHKSKITKEINKKFTAIEEKYKKDINARTNALSTLDKKLSQQTEEENRLKKLEISLKQKLKEKDDKEICLKGAIENYKSRDSYGTPRTLDSRLQVLETNIMKLETENKELKEKLESTESNVSGFIQEVNEILDSHEFNSKF